MFLLVQFQFQRSQAAVVPMMNKRQCKIFGTIKLYFFLYIYKRNNLQIYTQPNKTIYNTRTHTCTCVDTHTRYTYTPQALARPVFHPKVPSSHYGPSFEVQAHQLSLQKFGANITLIPIKDRLGLISVPYPHLSVFPHPLRGQWEPSEYRGSSSMELTLGKQCTASTLQGHGDIPSKPSKEGHQFLASAQRKECHKRDSKQTGSCFQILLGYSPEPCEHHTSPVERGLGSVCPHFSDTTEL